MDRVKCALCVFVLGLVLGTGQARDLFSAYPKPANLSDHYTLSGTGDDPWFWTCKKGVPLLHGRVKSNQLEVFGPTAPSDLQCAAMIAYISTFQRDPKNERAYVNAMLNAAEWSIPVRRVYSKRLLKSKYLEEATINTVEALIKNKSTKPQEGSTPHYTESATDSHEVTIGVESSIESKSTIGVPLVGSTEFTMRLGASYSNTNAHSETREISAPSQKMTLDPKTQALVSFTFWKKKKRNEYKLAFEVDEEDHFRRLKDQVKRKEIELKLYRGSSDPFVKFENDRFIVGDFPVTQTLWTYGVNVTFGEPEPLANDLPPGVMEVNF